MFSLPDRRGTRPRTDNAVPHLQKTQRSPERIRQALLAVVDRAAGHGRGAGPHALVTHEIPAGREVGDVQAQRVEVTPCGGQPPEAVVSTVPEAPGVGDTVRFLLDGEVVTRMPLIALEDIPEGGIWRTVVDTVLMMLE